MYYCVYYINTLLTEKSTLFTMPFAYGAKASELSAAYWRSQTHVNNSRVEIRFFSEGGNP